MPTRDCERGRGNFDGTRLLYIARGSDVLDGYLDKTTASAETDLPADAPQPQGEKLSNYLPEGKSSRKWGRAEF